jgi:hypothetical protein
MMARETDTGTAEAEDRNVSPLRRRLAYENAYRLKKKALISELEHAIDIGLYDALPNSTAR